MKKMVSLIMAVILAGCAASQSIRKTDLQQPENWQAAVTVTDMDQKKGRIVFLDENGETGTVSLALALADTEHPLPESSENIWVVPGFSMKDIQPGKQLYRLNRTSGEIDVLHTEPYPYTAASEKALYFAHTDGGTPAIAVIDRLDTETMQKTSLEYEGRLIRGLSASEHGVCLLSVSGGSDLQASFYDEALNEKMKVTLLDDTVGNIFCCIQGSVTAVIVQHIEQGTPCRTLFILNPDDCSVIRRELPFSTDGIPFAQDEDHILIIEAMGRKDVLITRYEISTGTWQESVFSGSFLTMTADTEHIWLIDQEQTVHVLDGHDPSVQISQFTVSRNDSEYVKAAFSRS